MVHTRGRQTMIERDGPVWTATEHPSPTALHVIIAHDLDALALAIHAAPRLTGASTQESAPDLGR